jgi:hypothetical protein
MKLKKLIVCCFLTTFCFYPFASAHDAGEITSRDHSSWYIGFGVGGGAGAISINNGPEAEQEGGVSIMFKVGAVISPHLLIGFDAGAWRYQLKDAAVQFNHYDAMVTLFPLSQWGLFLKGGVGMGNTIIDIDGKLWGRSQAGFDMRGGVGWEFKLGHAFYLGAEFDLASTIYEGGDVVTADANVLVTFSWY